MVRLGFAALALGVVALALGLHIHRLSAMAFTNYDDMIMGMTADRMRTQGWWAPYYELARGYALWQGRIYFYFSMFFFVAPFLIRSLLARAAVSALLQFGGVCSLAAVLGQYAGFESALLFLALAGAWLPYWLAVSPVIGYPFHYHLPLILFFAGVAGWIRTTRGQARRPRLARALSWGAIFLSLFFYEALLPLFLLVALAVAAAEARRAGQPWRIPMLIRAWIPWAVCYAIWAAIYLAFRWIHPATYAGSAVSLGRSELHSAAVSLYYFETYSLPGFNWIGAMHFLTPRMQGTPESLGYAPFFLRNLTVDGIVLAVAVVALVVWRSRRTSSGTSAAWPAAALALVCAVLSPLPLAFTAKYRSLDTVLTSAPYLPGYYSFLAWCVVFALAFPLLATALRRLPPVRWTVTLLLAAVCAVVCAANSMTNAAITRHFDESSDKWRMVDLLGRSRWYASLPSNAVFLAPGLWDGFPASIWDHADPYWTLYFSGLAGRSVPVIRIPFKVPDLLRRGMPVYYCEHQWLAGRRGSVLAVEPVVSVSAAGEAVSDEVMLFASGKPAGAAIAYRSTAAPGIQRAQIPQWTEENGVYIARVPLSNLIAGAAQVIDGEAPPALGPVVEFTRGFALQTEHDASGQFWRWSDSPDGAGELSLYNPSPQPVEVRFRAGLHFTPIEHAAVFDLESPAGTETFTAAAGEVLERTWRLAPGANRVRVKCHAGRLPAPGDPRYIVFGLWNWSVAPL